MKLCYRHLYTQLGTVTAVAQFFNDDDNDNDDDDEDENDNNFWDEDLE